MFKNKAGSRPENPDVLHSVYLNNIQIKLIFDI